MLKFLLPLLLSAFALAAPMPPMRQAVQLTYLKAHAGERARLRRFIVLNWFAMDKIAKERGLLERYRVVETGRDDGQWNVLVMVTYTNDRGYEGIKTQFEQIRQAHQTVLVDGKALADLGRIVESVTTYEELGDQAP